MEPQDSTQVNHQHPLPQISHLDSGCSALEQGTAEGHENSEMRVTRAVAFLFPQCGLAFIVMLIIPKLQLAEELMPNTQAGEAEARELQDQVVAEHSPP